MNINVNNESLRSLCYELGVMALNSCSNLGDYDIEGNFAAIKIALENMGIEINAEFLKEGFFSEAENYNYDLKETQELFNKLLEREGLENPEDNQDNENNVFVDDKKINKNLEEYNVENIGYVQEVYLTNDEVILIGTNKALTMNISDETANNEDAEVYVNVENRELPININQEAWSARSVFTLSREKIQITDIFVCSSEGYIELSNGDKLEIEIYRLSELIDNEYEYYRTYKRIETRIKK